MIKLQAKLAVVVVFAASVLACRGPRAPSGAPFVADDYAAARALARRTGRPIFVDVWATWCTVCKTMDEELADPRIAALHERFVWLSIDADAAANADFEKRFRADVLPHLYVIDPETERAVLDWPHAAKAEVLRELLTTSEAIVRAGEWDERRVAERWIAALEPAAANASEPEARIAYDDKLYEAYRVVGTIEKAIGRFEQSERDYPRWYAPPARLAEIHLALGDLDEAARAIERAASRAPRWKKREVDALAADIRAAREGRRY